jgi:hypothetical protein
MNEESNLKTENHWLYRILGGDLFWGHFDKRFLKIAFFTLIGLQVLTNLFVQTALVSTLAIFLLTILLFKNQSVSDFAFKEGSSAKNVKELIGFISLMTAIGVVAEIIKIIN